MVVKSREIICLPPTGIRASVLSWICWSLWLAKNKLIFLDKMTQPSKVATKCLATALEWDQAQSSYLSTGSEALQVRSTHRQAPRLPQTLCCFVDAAWDASSKRAGCASPVNNWDPSRQAQASSTMLTLLSWLNHRPSTKESQKQGNWNFPRSRSSQIAQRSSERSPPRIS